MDAEEILKRRAKETDVARILTLIAETPNRREQPKDGDPQGPFDFWFDGGAAQTITGWTQYEFADGTRATVNCSLLLSIDIDFGSGTIVTIDQTQDKKLTWLRGRDSSK